MSILTILKILVAAFACATALQVTAESTVGSTTDAQAESQQIGAFKKHGHGQHHVMPKSGQVGHKHKLPKHPVQLGQDKQHAPRQQLKQLKQHKHLKQHAQHQHKQLKQHKQHKQHRQLKQHEQHKRPKKHSLQKFLRAAKAKGAAKKKVGKQPSATAPASMKSLRKQVRHAIKGFMTKNGAPGRALGKRGHAKKPVSVMRQANGHKHAPNKQAKKHKSLSRTHAKGKGGAHIAKHRSLSAQPHQHRHKRHTPLKPADKLVHKKNRAHHADAKKDQKGRDHEHHHAKVKVSKHAAKSEHQQNRAEHRNAAKDQTGKQHEHHHAKDKASKHAAKSEQEQKGKQHQHHHAKDKASKPASRSEHEKVAKEQKGKQHEHHHAKDTASKPAVELEHKQNRAQHGDVANEHKGKAHEHHHAKDKAPETKKVDHRHRHEKDKNRASSTHAGIPAAMSIE